MARKKKGECGECRHWRIKAETAEVIAFGETPLKPLDIDKLQQQSYLIAKGYEISNYFKNPQLSLYLGFLMAKATK